VTGRITGLLLLIAGLACTRHGTVLAQESVSEVQASYQFLVSGRVSNGGVLYSVAGGPLRGLQLPLSFVDDADYWGGYVCTLRDNACAVRDAYSSTSYTLTPEAGRAGDLQTERVDTHNGTNIYDAATWQIAVVLGDVRHHFLSASRQDAYALANGQNRLLSEGFRRAADVRAVTSSSTFVYNGHRVTAPQAAYAFRMLSPAWLSPDPLMGTRYASLITTGPLPANNADYQTGAVTWSDWKPVTGENAWAFLIGPLQAAYLHFVLGQAGLYVPFHDLALQNALRILPTFAALQSPLGAVYYAPSGTPANQGKEKISPYVVSVENNLSLYAGLTILERTLSAEQANEKDLRPADRAAIEEALRIIAAMVNGGQAVPGPATQGLLSFFHLQAWMDEEFVQGGRADDPAAAGTWAATREPRAVDVNTWGIAALGAKRLDQWFGFGSAFRAWQSIKHWGGYGVGLKLWGVGYSDRDGNGMREDGTYQQGVLSAEWTAGAITAVRNMMQHYDSIAPGSADYAQAQTLLRTLRQDESDMLQGAQTQRADRYALTDFPGKPPSSVVAQTRNLQPYLYASRRHFIPFGWYANPIPSTCSTAWMIMVAEHFDPLGFAGEPN
jgi:hypothetical protein